MLQRILDLGDATLRRYDTSSLRYIASSGSALGAGLVTAVLERFGPVLYNVYGSTEVALATVATPADLAAAPATAGRVAIGSTVKVLDDAGGEVAAGTTGRIFVGSGGAFEGYTGGGGKEVVDGLLSTGDVGHFDAAGLLFVDGRDDEMIVSGGENVFPAEVEELLAAHPDIVDAAVVGVPDDRYGQVLTAYVVRRRGARLTEDDVTTPRARPPRPLQGAQARRVPAPAAADGDRQVAPRRRPLRFPHRPVTTPRVGDGRCSPTTRSASPPSPASPPRQPTSWRPSRATSRGRSMPSPRPTASPRASTSSSSCRCAPCSPARR